GMVKLWDMGARREVATLPGHTGGLECVTFSADGSILASGSYDATVRLWDVESGREISTLTGHGGGVHSVAFSPDGRTLVTGSDDHTTMLWDVASARRTMTLEGHDGRVIMVAFTPNGHAVVSGRAVNDWSETTDDAIRLWDVASGRQVDSFGGPMTLVRALAFSPDGEIVATSAGSLAEEVTLWNVASGRRVGALAGGASSLAFSPEGTIVAAGGRSGTTLWDVASRQLAATLAGQGSPAFRPDGAMLATAGGEIIALWDVASWQRVATIAAHPEGSFELAFSPNGTTLAGSGRDYTIRLWDVAVAAGAARAHGADVPLLTEVARLQGHTDSVLDLDFSSDGRLLASAGRDMTTKLWDVVAHRKVASLDAGGRSRAVAFSPNGRVVASVGEGTNTRLWDVASLRRIATVGGHANSFVYTLAFSPDGTLLASGRYGVLLWRVADTAVVTATAVDPRGKADATWARVKQAALTADETVVLPNYPNPFNPETWVPFDLSENANVTVSVYDAEGRIVRRLDLGAYPAGTYRTRGRAAHWDGRNEQGEVVSSGVYFAELRAGDYRSTRRIALRK
ncbi:T9SS type A sorting domain-containing protein, partial [Candidatus Poribacteria bacterium]|nr:T9SS type A sorting domain-containing protein [Candidatus Poribacteria bacterium]